MNAIVRLVKTLLTLWIILIYHPDLTAQDSVISIIKKANSGHFTASYYMGIFYKGSYITVINRGDGASQNGVSVDFVKLNSSTGAYISHESWEPDLPYPSNFYAGLLNWTQTVVRLNNGNYCVYGNTFGDFYKWVCAYQLDGEPEKREKGTFVLIR